RRGSPSSVSRVSDRLRFPDTRILIGLAVVNKPRRRRLVGARNGDGSEPGRGSCLEDGSGTSRSRLGPDPSRLLPAGLIPAARRGRTGRRPVLRRPVDPGRPPVPITCTEGGRVWEIAIGGDSIQIPFQTR